MRDATYKVKHLLEGEDGVFGDGHGDERLRAGLPERVDRDARVGELAHVLVQELEHARLRDEAHDIAILQREERERGRP
jgi:hypothetical protein